MSKSLESEDESRAGPLGGGAFIKGYQSETRIERQDEIGDQDTPLLPYRVKYDTLYSRWFCCVSAGSL